MRSKRFRMTSLLMSVAMVPSAFSGNLTRFSVLNSLDRLNFIQLGSEIIIKVQNLLI